MTKAGAIGLSSSGHVFHTAWGTIIKFYCTAITKVHMNSRRIPQNSAARMRFGVSFGGRLENNYRYMTRPYCIRPSGTITLNPASSHLPCVRHKVGMLAATQALTHPLVCPHKETCCFNLRSASSRQETLTLWDKFGKGDIFWHAKDIRIAWRIRQITKMRLRKSSCFSLLFTHALYMPPFIKYSLMFQDWYDLVIFAPKTTVFVPASTRLNNR